MKLALVVAMVAGMVGNNRVAIDATGFISEYRQLACFSDSRCVLAVYTVPADGSSWSDGRNWRFFLDCFVNSELVVGPCLPIPKELQ